MDELNQRIVDHLAQYGWHTEAVIRLCLAALLGGLVGLEREFRGREAGFRTNILVCVGSALVMLVSIRFASHPWLHPDEYNLNIDPGRIAYGVMTGIGFLGAGAIVRNGIGVRGLTTAAALWCVAAIGLAAGFQLYILSICAAIVVLVALWFLDYLEDILPRRRFRHLTIRCKWQPGCVKQMVDRLRAMGFSVLHHSFTRLGDLTMADIELSVSYRDPRKYYLLEDQLHSEGGYELVQSRREA